MTFRHLILLLILTVVGAAIGCNHERQPAERDNPRTYTPGPIRREQLSADQMRRIKRLQRTFQDVDPSPIDKWVDDFKRDEDPEREIQIYEGMADAYSAYCSRRALTLKAKQDVYQVVILRSGVPDSEVLKGLKLSVLSTQDAKDILKGYTSAPAPIIVTSEFGR